MSQPPSTPVTERVTAFSFASSKKRSAAAAGGVAKPHAAHKQQWEFFGPVGTTTLMLTLPIVQYVFYFGCRDSKYCISANPLSPEFPTSLPSLSSIQLALSSAWSWRAVAFYVIWFLSHVAVYVFVPARIVRGSPLPESDSLPEAERRLSYPLNGFASLILACVVLIAGTTTGYLPIKPTFGYDEFVGLLTTATVFSYLLALYLYVSSRLSSAVDTRTGLAPHGQSGNVLYDFFIGRTLNPRIGSFDWKYFCELRPGLILWMLLNFSMAAKQYELHGRVTNSMWLVCAFETFYVCDALFAEQSILTTMDITTDGFGWMLSYGDLAWVPFIYSLQARYLVDHPNELSIYGVALVLAVQAIGFWIFRGSNNEKDEFRTGRQTNAGDGKAAKQHTWIVTCTGSRLLTSGWWGMARHINYFGDWIMAVAWCLPTGCGHALPYFYAFYFAILLIHRERRDDKKCRDKYGADWVKYCEKVPYRIVPYVY